MIETLTGTILEKRPGRVVVDVGGVGYGLAVPVSTYEALPPAGGRATLLVHTRVREDAIDLYGFATRAERETFLAILKVDGFAARTAISVLSAMPVSTFRRAVAEGDIDTLTRIPGVGRKSAQKLVLELRGEMAAEPVEAAAPAEADDAVEALAALGYPLAVARAAVAAARAAQPAGAPAAEIVRTALRNVA